MPWQLKAQQQEKESCRPTKRAACGNMLARQLCAQYGRAAPSDQVWAFK